MDSNRTSLLPPPSPMGSTSSLPTNSKDGLSLSVNYIPTKFSSGLLSPGGPKRRRGKAGRNLTMPKMGGGVDAFSKAGMGAGRLGGQGGYEDEDDDVMGDGKAGYKKKKKRWTRFKWILFIANILLTIYSLVALVVSLLTYFNIWTHADIVRVGNATELALSMVASVIGLTTSLVGWAGILLNNRPFLAVYSLMTWITFAFLVVPGYITYRKKAFNLEGKLNKQWSQDLGTSGRLRIQNQLGCCGWFSPFVEATVSATCYARSILPGCKQDYLFFERKVLINWYVAAFSLVPVHLGVMISALLCSNHVTYRFGKGMMPKRYRLGVQDMALIMEGWATQLADQYGPDVASDIVAKTKSQSNLNLPGSLGNSSSSLADNSPRTAGLEKSLISAPVPGSQSGGYGAVPPGSPGGSSHGHGGGQEQSGGEDYAYEATAGGRF